MNKDKTTDSVNESGFKRTSRRLKIKLSNANRANIEGAKNAILRRETRLVRSGENYYRPPPPRTPPKNRNRKIPDSVNNGLDEGRYERLRDADIKKHGYTELPGRNDPKRSHVYKAQTRAIGRARRVAGIVPGSANAQPINISNILSRSARKSAEARFAGKPSPRIPRKNRDRTIADSFNHGLEEAKRPIKQSKTILGAAGRGAIDAITTPKPAGTSGTTHVVRGALRNIIRHITDKFL